MNAADNDGFSITWKQRENKPVGKGKITVIKNKGVEIDKQKYNFTDIEYQYTFNYKSFLPYPYRLYGFTDPSVSLVDNGIDNVLATVDQKKFTIKENSFTLTTQKTEFEFMHSIPNLQSEDGEKIKLNNDFSKVEISENNGRTDLTQNTHNNWPQNINITAISAYNLNQNNEFDEYRSKLFESKKSISVPSINSGESSSHYNTHVWGSSSKNISQIVSVYSEDFTVYNFTNQERLIDRNAFFNLGEGENVINRGDIELTYDFKNYKLPENDGNKNFAPSKYFEISINVVFDDKLYSNDINNGMFYTYASLSTDKEDDGVKIVSVKINNKETGIAKAYADNYITVRTTPFSGNAKIKLLFKFFDSKLRETLDESLVPKKEKLVFNNLGGQFLFTNSSWDIKNNTNLEEMRFRTIRFDSIVESASNNEIRSYSTKKLYFGVKTNNELFRAKSLIISEQSNLAINIQPFKKEGTVIEHEYLDKDLKVVKENITLNKGEVYVDFYLNNWNPCIKNKEGKMPIKCGTKESDTISAKVYLDEIIPGYDDQKPAINNKKEKDLKIEWTPLKGNYNESSSNSIDNLPDFTENMIKFDFKSTANMTKLQGAFKVKYTVTDNSTPSSDNGNTMLYIIIAIIAVIIIGGISFFFLRRGKMRRACEDARRLNEDSA